MMLPDHGKEGEAGMTKAKARQRAKAKAAQKAKKREANAEQPEQQPRSGQFDPGSFLQKGPGMNANIKNFGAARRGASRSR
ncbi:MAG TPA: hypothetical protein QGF63_00055 [Alphaproteobacteria bacterium]|nr:hypothetical protein [Alphaproteobacteria bacterium]HJM48218.1 hypothetical protein [Alphaproteobacteria bacterium]